MAAATDLSFNLYGYAAVFGNDFMTALYLIMVKNTPTAGTLTTTVRFSLLQILYFEAVIMYAIHSAAW